MRWGPAGQASRWCSSAGQMPCWRAASAMRCSASRPKSPALAPCWPLLPWRRRWAGCASAPSALGQRPVPWWMPPSAAAGRKSPRWPLLPSPGPRSAPQTLPLPRRRWGSAAARRQRSCWSPGGGPRPLPPVRAGVCWGCSVFPPPARPCPCSSAPGWALRPPPFSQKIG